MTSQPSTLPAEAIRKGHIRSYNSGTHKADVQLVGSMPRLLADIRVASDIPAATCVVDREVTVLFFEHTNPADAVVITVQGALPSGGSAFSCGDLAACSLANLGTRHHHDTTGRSDDDHTQYPLLAGRSGGQLLKGDVAASGHLTLQATAHATRGYVRAQDDLQLLSNIIRDSAATARLTLATASPHLVLTGDVQLTALASVGSGATINAQRALSVIETIDTAQASAIYALVNGNRTAGPQFTYGVAGGARAQGTPSSAFVYGLYYFAQHDTPSYTYQLGGILIQQQSGAAGTGPLALARCFYASPAYWGGSHPTSSYGLDVEDQGGASVTTAYGVRVHEQTGATVRLLELGPATPYARVIGGGNPPANMTNLYLKEQATLRRVQWKAGNTLGAGDRVMVLV